MKKKKILKVVTSSIIIVLVILLVILITYLTRNFVIVNKLAKAQEKFNSSNNYSYTVEYYYKGNHESTLQYYYKDGKMLKISKSLQNNESSIIWYDENAKETMYINPNDLTAAISAFKSLDKEIEIMSMKPIEFDNVIKNVLKFFITSDKIDGKDYYILHPLIGTVSNIYYYEKEEGNISLFDVGYYEENGKKYTDSTIIIKDLKFNEVTDNQVNKPDLTGYEITDQRYLPNDKV